MDDLHLRELLSELAAEMPADPGRRERPTLRRARGRRLTNAVLVGAAAAVVVVAGFAGVRALVPGPQVPVPGATGPSDAPTPSATPTPTPTLGPGVVLPEPVAATRDAILRAAQAGDFDALGDLIDPDRFAYNFSDGHDPIPEWRADPTIVDTIAAIMEMPPGLRETPSGDFYVWPYLLDADLTALTEDELALLASIGIGPEELDAMIAFGGYTGPRAVIGADGTWTSYTVGGD